jgi:hypothetical protein
MYCCELHLGTVIREMIRTAPDGKLAVSVPVLEKGQMENRCAYDTAPGAFLVAYTTGAMANLVKGQMRVG